MVLAFVRAIICQHFHRNLKLVTEPSSTQLVVLCKDCDIKELEINFSRKNVVLTHWFKHEYYFASRLRDKVLFFPALIGWIISGKNGQFEYPEKDERNYTFIYENVTL